MTATDTPSTLPDIPTQLLIARLLEEDLTSIENGKVAEKLQLDLVLYSDPNSKTPQPHFQEVDTNEEVAMQMFTESARVTADTVLAQSLHNSLDIASYQLAQKLAAAEKKIMLDAEFARRLQAASDSGQIDMDAPEMQDADRVLGSEVVNGILAQDINDKGKGRVTVTASSSGATTPDVFSPTPAPPTKFGWLSGGKGKSKQMDEPPPEYTRSNPYPICDICFEPFQVTNSPISASQTANSSSRLPFGLRLPCPGQHPYCISCLAEYIKGKLDPSGNGDMGTDTTVFPIRCPGCPIVEWETGIEENVAEKVLDREYMSIWHHRKLLDSLPRQYCPNPKCSVLVQIDEDPDDPQAQCPACFQWVCVLCKAMWHQDMSCEQYQSLPMDERSPEDQLAIELAKAKQWRRCPGCHAIVELTVGCNHITCRCKKEFCFKCGSLWDTKKQRCTSDPACELWDEAMLLDTREREREANVNRRDQDVPGVALGARDALPPPMFPELLNLFGRGRRIFQRHPDVPEPDVPEPPRPEPPRFEPPRFEPHRFEPPRRAPQLPYFDVVEDFDWIDDHGVLSLVHPFTREMITTLTCGYCDSRLSSIDDLKYHLNNVRYHPVFSCCGRFFRRDIDLERHREGKPYHNNEVIRNV